MHFGLFRVYASACISIGPEVGHVPQCTRYGDGDGYTGNNALDVLLSVDNSELDGVYRGPLHVQTSVIGETDGVVCHPLGRSNERDVTVRCSGHSSPSAVGSYTLSVVITSHLYSERPASSNMECVDAAAPHLPDGFTTPGRVEVNGQDQSDYPNAGDYDIRFSATSDVDSTHSDFTIGSINQVWQVSCNSNYRWAHIRRNGCSGNAKWSAPLDMFPFLHGDAISPEPSSGTYSSTLEEAMDISSAASGAGVSFGGAISTLTEGSLTLAHSGVADGTAPVFVHDNGVCYTMGMEFEADTSMTVTADIASIVNVGTVFVVAKALAPSPFSLFANSNIDTSFRQTLSGTNAIADFQEAKMDRVRINGLIVSGSTVQPLVNHRAVYVFEDIDSYVAKFGDADGATGGAEGINAEIYEVQFHSARLSDADIVAKTRQLADSYRIELLPEPEFDVLGSFEAFADPNVSCSPADTTLHAAAQGMPLTGNLRAWFDASAHNADATAALTRRSAADEDLEDGYTVIVCDLSGTYNNAFTPPPFAFDDGQVAGWSEGHRPVFVEPTEGIYFPDDSADGAGSVRLLLSDDIDDAQTLFFVAEWWGGSSGDGTLFGRAVRSTPAPGSGGNELFDAAADIAAIYVNGVQRSLATAMRPTDGLAVITIELTSPSLVNQLSAGFGDGWIGRISEVLIYGATLSEIERLTVEGYLSNKWLT